ncbi:hypothetical protein ABW21_db0204452 [Orbilia brochopaga]|nr:hypothetical protein ABW21_db0204452 [Drechslerella brochopaga]
MSNVVDMTLETATPWASVCTSPVKQPAASSSDECAIVSDSDSSLNGDLQFVDLEAAVRREARPIGCLAESSPAPQGSSLSVDDVKVFVTMQPLGSPVTQVQSYQALSGNESDNEVNEDGNETVDGDGAVEGKNPPHHRVHLFRYQQGKSSNPVGEESRGITTGPRSPEGQPGASSGSNSRRRNAFSLNDPSASTDPIAKMGDFDDQFATESPADGLARMENIRAGEQTHRSPTRISDIVPRKTTSRESRFQERLSMEDVRLTPTATTSDSDQTGDIGYPTNCQSHTLRAMPWLLRLAYLFLLGGWSSQLPLMRVKAKGFHPETLPIIYSSLMTGLICISMLLQGVCLMRRGPLWEKWSEEQQQSQTDRARARSRARFARSVATGEVDVPIVLMSMIPSITEEARVRERAETDRAGIVEEAAVPSIRRYDRLQIRLIWMDAVLVILAFGLLLVSLVL